MMLRTQISLTEDERRTLDAVAARTGKSISALIREAVTEVYGVERHLADDLAILRSVAGSWVDNDEGVAAIEQLQANDAGRFDELYRDRIVESK